jgi:hypothetical protein
MIEIQPCPEIAGNFLTANPRKTDLRRSTPIPIDFSQVVPTEYRADGVIKLVASDDGVAGAIVVEVQLRRDNDKLDSWPVYLTALRAKLRCPVTLLVLTPLRSVAEWARAPIAIGHPGFVLTPIAVSFSDLPRIIDPADASRLPELAVLSAMAHGDLAVATTAIEAVRGLPEDQSKLYLDAILARLPDEIRQPLQATMKNYEYQSEFARKYYFQGRDEGREEGRDEGLDQGHSEGLRDAVLTLARSKLKAVSASHEAAIRALANPHALAKLISALGQARNAAETRGALAQALRKPRGKRPPDARPAQS